MIMDRGEMLFLRAFEGVLEDNLCGLIQLSSQKTHELV